MHLFTPATSELWVSLFSASETAHRFIQCDCLLWKHKRYYNFLNSRLAQIKFETRVHVWASHLQNKSTKCTTAVIANELVLKDLMTLLSGKAVTMYWNQQGCDYVLILSAHTQMPTVTLSVSPVSPHLPSLLTPGTLTEMFLCLNGDSKINYRIPR